MTIKVAKLVSRKVVSPKHEHDCGSCNFLGRLDGEDLYVHHEDGDLEHPQYVRRHGSDGPDYGSLGDLAPPGTPYALARKLYRKREIPPLEWRTAG